MSQQQRIFVGALVALAFLAGCSTSSDGNYSQTLSLLFNPMFSGYDGVHTYQLPCTIGDQNVAGVTDVKWKASDPSIVDLAPQPDGVSVMITTKKPGMVTITATTANAIGKAPLTIASYAPDQWAAGQTRYSAGSKVSLGMGIRMDGGYVACTSCHSSNPGSQAVEHTPEQTGGFTDAQLKAIFLNGVLAPSDANPLQINPMKFHAFHQWQVANDDEANGLVVYLRGLAPTSQGDIDFGGHGHGDGGMRHDGGVGH